MCRNIKTLRQATTLASHDEIRLAALQYVRKVSGFRAPSQSNQAVFDAAVDEVAQATARLLEDLRIAGQPTSRPHAGSPGQTSA